MIKTLEGCSNKKRNSKYLLYGMKRVILLSMICGKEVEFNELGFSILL